MRLAPLCLVLGLALAGCGDDPEPVARPGGSSVQEGTSTVESGAPCVPAAEVDQPLPASYPSRFPLPPGTVLTDVRRQGERDLVTGRVEGDAEALLTHFRDAAEPAGLAVVRDEDEGRAGRLQLCGAAVTVDVTVARLTCPRGSAGFTLAVQVP